MSFLSDIHNAKVYNYEVLQPGYSVTDLPQWMAQQQAFGMGASFGQFAGQFGMALIGRLLNGSNNFACYAGAVGGGSGVGTTYPTTSLVTTSTSNKTDYAEESIKKIDNAIKSDKEELKKLCKNLDVSGDNYSAAVDNNVDEKTSALADAQANVKNKETDISKLEQERAGYEFNSEDYKNLTKQIEDAKKKLTEAKNDLAKKNTELNNAKKLKEDVDKVLVHIKNLEKEKKAMNALNKANGESEQRVTEEEMNKQFENKIYGEVAALRQGFNKYARLKHAYGFNPTAEQKQELLQLGQKIKDEYDNRKDTSIEIYKDMEDAMKVIEEDIKAFS